MVLVFDPLEARGGAGLDLFGAGGGGHLGLVQARAGGRFDLLVVIRQFALLLLLLLLLAARGSLGFVVPLVSPGQAVRALEGRGHGDDDDGYVQFAERRIR